MVYVCRGKKDLCIRHQIAFSSDPLDILVPALHVSWPNAHRCNWMMPHLPPLPCISGFPSQGCLARATTGLCSVPPTCMYNQGYHGALLGSHTLHAQPGLPRGSAPFPHPARTTRATTGLCPVPTPCMHNQGYHGALLGSRTLHAQPGLPRASAQFPHPACTTCKYGELICQGVRFTNGSQEPVDKLFLLSPFAPQEWSRDAIYRHLQGVMLPSVQ